MKTCDFDKEFGMVYYNLCANTNCSIPIFNSFFIICSKGIAKSLTKCSLDVYREYINGTVFDINPNAVLAHCKPKVLNENHLIFVFVQNLRIGVGQ